MDNANFYGVLMLTVHVLLAVLSSPHYCDATEVPGASWQDHSAHTHERYRVSGESSTPIDGRLPVRSGKTLAGHVVWKGGGAGQPDYITRT